MPTYFKGTVDNCQREKIGDWKDASEEDQQFFTDSFKAWEGIEHLRRMKIYNSEKALEKVSRRIKKHSFVKLRNAFQKIAAVLILPLLVATLYLATRIPVTEWYTLKTPVGLRSELLLSDGTRVYLNSKTTLIYPLIFNGSTRDVTLSGEAYFEVAENKKQPFVVNTGKVNIEVTGTEFTASNYPDENLTEIVLVSGEINLFQGKYSKQKKNLHTMLQGEKATFDGNELYFDKVEVDKYTSWKEGILIFRDDSMKEVVLRLNRWFNVDIRLMGKSMEDYVYTATFQDESLIQILDLLKISAPIDYKIKQRDRKPDKTFSNMEIEIIQR